jgi:hypothetical protein
MRVSVRRLQYSTPTQTLTWQWRRCYQCWQRHQWGLPLAAVLTAAPRHPRQGLAQTPRIGAPSRLPTTAWAWAAVLRPAA